MQIWLELVYVCGGISPQFRTAWCDVEERPLKTPSESSIEIQGVLDLNRTDLGKLTAESNEELTSEWMGVWAANPLERRKYGVFYTPEIIAKRIVDIALETLGREPARVLEPSCGTGAFLQAFSEAARARWRWGSPEFAKRLLGVELDPIAVGVAQSTSDARVIHADFLGAWSNEADGHGFDLIIGNPPFGGAIRKDTGRDAEEKQRLRDRFPLSAVGAYDRSALFVERALELLSPGGVLAFVLPRSVLASPSARGLRRELAQRGAPAIIEMDDSNLFESADVHVCGVVVGGTSTPDRARIYGIDSRSNTYQEQPFSTELTSWSPLVEGTSAFVLSGRGFPTLGSCLDISASATTGEAYEWAPFVGDEVNASIADAPPSLGGNCKTREMNEEPGENASIVDALPSSGGTYREYRLVISGSIDPFENRWIARPSRYLGEVYERPVIDRAALSARRRQQASSPKVLMPGLSRCLEAAIDADGGYIGAVATQTIRPKGGQPASAVHLLRIAAILNSAWCRLQYRARYASTALSGGNIAVSRNKLEEITMLPEWRLWLRDEPLFAPEGGVSEANSHERSSILLASIESDLAEVGMSGSLYKEVCTPEQFGLLATVARRIAESLSLNARVIVLDDLLTSAPRACLDSGVMDVLLLSIAEKSIEVVAPIDLSVE